MTHRIAKTISYLFDPIVIGLITIFLIIKATPISGHAKIGWYALVMLVAVVPPVGLFLYQRATGKISDWYISKRSERKDVLLMAVAGNFLLLIVVYLLKAPHLLLVFCLLSLIVDLTVYLVTFFYKISGHLIATTLFVLVLLLVYSVNWWPTMLLIVLVAWSRLYLKAHTFGEVTSGILAAILLAGVVFKLFSLI